MKTKHYFNSKSQYDILSVILTNLSVILTKMSEIVNRNSMLCITMIIKNNKTTLFITAIVATIVILTVFSANMQNTFAILITETDAQINEQKLVNAHQVLTQKMSEKNVVAKLEQEKIDPENADVPLVLSYADPQSQTLIIGVDSDGKLDDIKYEKKIRTLVGNIPIQILHGKFVRDTCDDLRLSACRPLWGGVQEQNSGLYGSLGVYALKGTVHGYIMSGHVAGTNGQLPDIYQPVSSITPKIGTITANPVLQGNTRTADASFITPSSGTAIENIIFTSPNTGYLVKLKVASSSTPALTSIRMTSANAGGSVSGWIQATGVTVSDSTGTLTQQVRASYSGYTTSGGDSGAPVYSVPNAQNQVDFYGIHVGKFCVDVPTPCTGPVYPIYSPWEGIKSALGLTS